MLVRSDAYLIFRSGESVFFRSVDAAKKFMIGRVEEAMELYPDQRERIRRRNLTDDGKLRYDNKYDIDPGEWGKQRKWKHSL